MEPHELILIFEKLTQNISIEKLMLKHPHIYLTVINKILKIYRYDIS